MQVREFFASRGIDSSLLLGAVIEDGTKSGEGDGLDAMAVSAHYCRRHGQGIENGFFRGFDRRRDQWIQVCIGEVRLLKRQLFGIVGDDVRRGKGQHEVAAAMARGGACARQSQRGTFSQPSELSAIEWSIGGNDDDDRALALPR